MHITYTAYIMSRTDLIPNHDLFMNPTLRRRGNVVQRAYLDSLIRYCIFINANLSGRCILIGTNFF